MLGPLCLLLVAALLALLAPASAFQELTKGKHQEFQYSYGTPIELSYAVYDYDARIDITMWVTKDNTITGDVCFDESFRDSTCFNTLLPHTTTTLTLPDDFKVDAQDTYLPIYIRIQGTQKVTDENVSVYVSDGFYLADGVSSHTSSVTHFIGNTRYYKFFVCDSNEDINVKLEVYPEILSSVSIYAAKDIEIPEPNANRCTSSDKCLIAQDTLSQTETEWEIDASNYDQPGWLIIAVTADEPEHQNYFGLTVENMDYTAVYPNQGKDDPAVREDLCMYESCTANFIYKADTSKSLVVSAWNDNREYMLRLPPHITGNISKGPKLNDKFQSSNGVLYISETDMADHFEGMESVDLYFSVNNQYAITYPSLGAKVNSPIKFGLCQGCDPIYPHGSKYYFKGTKEQMSRGRFIIPFAYDERQAPVYANTNGRSSTDPENPFRPSYAFMFRNYKKSNNSEQLEEAAADGKTINVCPWEFLISTTYNERTQTIEETYFDAVIYEDSAASGGAGYEITPTTVSSRTANTQGFTDDDRYFYREEMTVFAHMYPHSFNGSPNVCINDVNYIYVGDIHEINPTVLYGPDSGIETELTFTTKERNAGEYYPLHVKVTLTDDLTDSKAPNFVLTVKPRDETVASVLIVGSPSVYLPDPEYDTTLDGAIVSNNGYHCASPRVSVMGSKYAGKKALYFTIDFLASSTITLTFSREDQVSHMVQGIPDRNIKFLTEELVFAAKYDATLNGFEDGFFAAIITNKDDENTHHGAKFCVNTDPTTKPEAKCNNADKKNKLEIYTLSTNESKRRGALVKNLSTNMLASESYVRLMPHPGYANGSEADITAMFGVSRELDGADLENDVQHFKFDTLLSPIYFQMIFNTTQDGRIKINSVGDLSDGTENPWTVNMSICKDFPRLYKDMTDGLQCSDTKISMNGSSNNEIYLEMGVNKMLPTAGTSTLWGSIFGTNVVGGGQVQVDFSQSRYLDETKNNLFMLQGNNYSYGFGTIPLLSNTAGAGNVKNIRYIVSVTAGVNGVSGDLFMSQTEIHPTAQTESNQKYSWPSEQIFSLTVQNSRETTKMDRVYLSFRCTSCKPTDSRAIYVNVNLIYELDFESSEALYYHPTMSTEKPLISAYDVTSDFEFRVPHDAVSYFFYPYDNTNGPITSIDDLNKLSSYTVKGGSNINEVNSRATSQNVYNISGKGILPMTISKNAVSKDVDDNYRMYFSVWKSSDAADNSDSVVTSVFDLVDTSFTLDPDTPIDDTIIDDPGMSGQSNKDDYVPILLNYKAPSDTESVQLMIETCRLKPLASGSHKFCRSRFVHNPGPSGTSSNYSAESCVEIGDKDETLTLNLDESKGDFHVFYGIHAGVGSSYRLTTILNGNSNHIQISDKKVGHSDFQASKSVTLRVAPAYGTDKNPMPFAWLYIYYFPTSMDEFSHSSPCGYEQSGYKPRIFNSTYVESLYNKSLDEIDSEYRGLVPLEFNLSELNKDEEYYVNVVAVYGNFKVAYNPIRIIPNKSISGLDVTPPPDLWWVWLIVALVIIAAIVVVLVYLFIWRPRAEEKKQYQELDDQNDGKAEAIAVEDDNVDPLA